MANLYVLTASSFMGRAILKYFFFLPDGCLLGKGEVFSELSLEMYVYT